MISNYIKPTQGPILSKINGVFTLLIIFSMLFFQIALSHDIVEDRGQDDVDYQNRVARMKYLEQYKMNEGLRQRAIFKIQRNALESFNTPPQEMQRLLFRGPQPAFPFTAQPELKSDGDVRTLTALIDFKDHRASGIMPSQPEFEANIYGSGTMVAENYIPYESVNSYYNRASEGKVNIQGQVLDWYHFSKNRSEYEPELAAEGPFQDKQQALLDNQALFDMVSEVLKEHDASHDFAQYDNDNDGDIDLLTILYSGPRGAWSSFWWAYRWEFFVQDASTTMFDGKKLKQFVFQFVDKREDTNDFNPKTLIHEMGHAFGLADYYDYDPEIGPPGGVGGLDMMHGNWGNHSAFSRWLLDWIKPEVIGNHAPSQKSLVASGSKEAGVKAIAIFPELSNPIAPSSEMFIVENRQRMGNDGHNAETPNDGLLIWHIDANVNLPDDKFAFDNSFTPRKLIRLVRSNTDQDFLYQESANSNTYFNTGSELTANSVPNSNGYDGVPTNISVTNISEAGEIMTADIGIAIPGAPPPQPVVETHTNTQGVESAVEDISARINYDDLDEFDKKLAVATVSELEKLWKSAESSDSGNAINQTSLKKQLILTRWASKDGEGAAKALFAIPNNSFIQKNYPAVMQSWATNNPTTASKWYFSNEQTYLRNSNELKNNAEFTEKLFCCSTNPDSEATFKQLDKLSNVAEIYGALNGLNRSTEYSGTESKIMEERYKTLQENKVIVEKIQSLQNTIDEIDINSIENMKQRAEFNQLLLKGGILK